MAIPRGAVVLALVVSLSLSACQSTAKQGSAREDGYARLTEGNYDAAASSFEKAAALSSDPQERARAYIGLGAVHLQRGEPQEALGCFNEARRIHHVGDVASATNRGIGTAHFQLGEWSLSRRYLQKGVQGGTSEERQACLARLSVCCAALGDVASADWYRKQLSQPHSSVVSRILATDPRSSRSQNGQVVSRLPRGIGDGEGAWTPSGANAEEAAPAAPSGSKKIRVLPRQDWNASSARSNLERMGPIDKITIHHTGGRDFWATTQSAAAHEILGIQHYHQDQRGWADIGYHYIIDRSGNVWQGRRLAYQGAHARGALNEGNIGIALLGNFCSQKPTQAQYASLSILVEKLCYHFNVSPRQVYTHGELAQGKTSCPGPALQSCVQSIRSQLQRRLVAYRTSTSTTR